MSAKGPWSSASLAQLREWDPGWADAVERVATNPRASGALSLKLVELVSIGLNAACTNLQELERRP